MLVVGNEDKLVIGASPNWNEVNARVCDKSVIFGIQIQQNLVLKTLSFQGVIQCMTMRGMLALVRYIYYNESIWNVVNKTQKS